METKNSCEAVEAKVTSPFVQFNSEEVALLELVSFSINLAEERDRGAYIAKHTLQNMDKIGTEEKVRSLKEIVSDFDLLPISKETKPNLHKMRNFRRLFLEILYCRGIDNFLTYISNLLQLIMRAKPDLLKSNEQIRVEEALSFDSIDSLTSHIIEKKVSELSYLGMRDLDKYLKDRIGLSPFRDENELNRAVDTILVRNLITHNRGIVNKIFISRASRIIAEIGTIIPLKNETVFAELEFLKSSALNLDKSASDKFKLLTESLKMHIHK